MFLINLHINCFRTYCIL